MTRSCGEKQSGMEMGWAAPICIISIAAVLRLYDLDLKPLHHDEGVNAFFLERLLTNGFYRYDPSNYHGPTLYYLALPISKAFGLTVFSIRLLPALSGITAVSLTLSLRRRIGATAALAAASLLAVSPGAVYFSRYFIHESLFLLFGFAMVVAALKYVNTARHLAAALLAVMAALLFSTKETAIITAGVQLIALISVGLLVGAGKRNGRAAFSEAILRLGGLRAVASTAIVAICIFAAVVALFYSSFFTNPRWACDLLRAFGFWSRTGATEHVHSWHAYISWLFQQEPVLAGLAVWGSVLAFYRQRQPHSALAQSGSPAWQPNRFALFAAFWAAWLLAAYSLIPYKTPWLSLNFTVPLAVLAGYGVQLMLDRVRVLGIIVMSAALGVSSAQAVQLAYFGYDDDKYPYVYAHTLRRVVALVDLIDHLAGAMGGPSVTSISITSPEYWPLPWYLRNYQHVSYHGKVVAVEDAIVIGSVAQQAELDAQLGSDYQRLAVYSLRPGVDLVVYIRRSSLGSSTFLQSTLREFASDANPSIS